MDTQTLDIESYCKRIQFSGDYHATIETLRELLLKHITHIPFENIDVLLQRPISLDLYSLQQKLIQKKRGGYCFEINTLFSSLLKAFGFQVTTHEARVYYGRVPNADRPRTHMILKVYVQNKEWLVDATFGALGFIQPFCLSECDTEKPQGSLRLIADSKYPNRKLFQSKFCGKWTDLYAFEETLVSPIDYEVANFYTSQHPNSAFRKNLVAMSIDPVSGKSLIFTNQEWVETDRISRKTELIQSKESAIEKLTKHMGIRLTPEDLKFPFPVED